MIWRRILASILHCFKRSWMLYTHSHLSAEHGAARREYRLFRLKSLVVTADVDGEEPVARWGNPDSHGGKVEKVRRGGED